MKASIMALFITCLGLEGCCTSLMCQLTKAAEADLQCDPDQLKVENQSQLVREQPGRILRVAGCGRDATYRCDPTNLPPEPTVKVRGKAVEHKTALELRWRCTPAEAQAMDSSRRLSDRR